MIDLLFNEIGDLDTNSKDTSTYYSRVALYPWQQ